METINTTPERIMALMTDALESIWHCDKRIEDKTKQLQQLAAKVADYSTREMMYSGGMCFKEMQRESDNLRSYANEMRGLVQEFGSLRFLCEIKTPEELREDVLPELLQSDKRYQEMGRDMLVKQGLEIYIREACL